MAKMMIFEPAMCCSTGLCGVGVDSELLRISTVFDTLQKNGIAAERYNLASAPMEFVNRAYVQDILKTQGVSALPLTVIDDQVKITSRYPSNEEIIEMLALSHDLLNKQPATMKLNLKKNDDCCPGGNCC